MDCSSLDEEASILFFWVEVAYPLEGFCNLGSRLTVVEEGLSVFAVLVDGEVVQRLRVGVDWHGCYFYFEEREVVENDCEFVTIDQIAMSIIGIPSIKSLINLYSCLVFIVGIRLFISLNLFLTWFSFRAVS